MKQSTCIVLAALNMLIAVGAGAFGAHGLKVILSTDMLAVWQTAVHYQMVHALGLFGLGILMAQWIDATLLGRAAVTMLVGIIVFSGSLYALALSGILWLGAITPIGGVAFLVAWGMLAWCAYRRQSSSSH
ncbi:DUF423 domain-containing protein [Undibacterium sp. SXout11W]|uniref:DUF423 domain-containing protein n=1 Tax=Undibacterium sp. SXout11W TaxID=3413050 RepID=UPI003BEFAA56